MLRERPAQDRLLVLVLMLVALVHFLLVFLVLLLLSHPIEEVEEEEDEGEENQKWDIIWTSRFATYSPKACGLSCHAHGSRIKGESSRLSVR